jgi:hypothetical protein
MITRHGYDIYVQLFSRIVFVDTHFYCVKTGIRVVSSIRALRNWAVGPTGPDSSDRIAGFGSALDSGVDPTLSHALEREMLRNYTNGSGPHGWGPGPDPAYAFPDPYGWVLVLHVFSSNPRTRILDLAAWHLDPTGGTQVFRPVCTLGSHSSLDRGLVPPCGSYARGRSLRLEASPLPTFNASAEGMPCHA